MFPHIQPTETRQEDAPFAHCTNRRAFVRCAQEMGLSPQETARRMIKHFGYSPDRYETIYKSTRSYFATVRDSKDRHRMMTDIHHSLAFVKESVAECRQQIIDLTAAVQALTNMRVDKVMSAIQRFQADERQVKSLPVLTPEERRRARIAAAVKRQGAIQAAAPALEQTSEPLSCKPPAPDRIPDLFQNKGSAPSPSQLNGQTTV